MDVAINQEVLLGFTLLKKNPVITNTVNSRITFIENDLIVIK